MASSLIKIEIYKSQPVLGLLLWTQGICPWMDCISREDRSPKRRVKWQT